VLPNPSKPGLEIPGADQPHFLNRRYVQPNFFQPNFLLSFIQYVIGPYTDELGNVLPHAVPELGVPVNPVAFAGLLGRLFYHFSVSHFLLFLFYIMSFMFKNYLYVYSLPSG
jgi:hypothetical protein